MTIDPTEPEHHLPRGFDSDFQTDRADPGSTSPTSTTPTTSSASTRTTATTAASSPSRLARRRSGHERRPPTRSTRTGREYIPNTPGVGSIGYTATPTPFLNFRHAPNDRHWPGTSAVQRQRLARRSKGRPPTTFGPIDFVNNGVARQVEPRSTRSLKANAGDTSPAPPTSTGLHRLRGPGHRPGPPDLRRRPGRSSPPWSTPTARINNGIGTDVAANYSRNGNLQDEQFYYGASAQPSNLAAQAAGALFYASGQGITGGPIRPQPAQQRQPDLGRQRRGQPAPIPRSGTRRGTTHGDLHLGSTGDGDRHRPDRGRHRLRPDRRAAPAPMNTTTPRSAATITDFFRVNGSSARRPGSTTTSTPGVPLRQLPVQRRRRLGRQRPERSPPCQGQRPDPRGEHHRQPDQRQPMILISSVTGNALRDRQPRGSQWAS